MNTKVTIAALIGLLSFASINAQQRERRSERTRPNQASRQRPAPRPAGEVKPPKSAVRARRANGEKAVGVRRAADRANGARAGAGAGADSGGVGGKARGTGGSEVPAKIRAFFKKNPQLRARAKNAADADGDGKLSPSEMQKMKRIVQRMMNKARTQGGEKKPAEGTMRERLQDARTRRRNQESGDQSDAPKRARIRNAERGIPGSETKPAKGTKRERLRDARTRRRSQQSGDQGDAAKRGRLRNADRPAPGAVRDRRAKPSRGATDKPRVKPAPKRARRGKSKR